jgi:phage tail sheath protein FI
MMPKLPNDGVGIPVAVAHPIAGVATSVAAFIGWAPKGPTTEAMPVTSMLDFEVLYGGLTQAGGVPNYLGYAVNQFFDNGGTQAYVVRVVWDGSLASSVSPAPAVCTTARAVVGGTLALFAANPGQWANSLVVAVSLQEAGGFTMQIQDSSGDVLEEFSSLSVEPTSPRYVVEMIDQGSQCVTFVDPAHPQAGVPAPGLPLPTGPGGVALAGGADGEVLVPGGNGDFERALGAGTSVGLGLHLLDPVRSVSLLCVPGETDGAMVRQLQAYCAGRRAFLLVDCPPTATLAGLGASGPVGTGQSPTVIGPDAANAAYYFPWVLAPDPLANQAPASFPPSGFVAGIYASTDSNLGVWKAPAGAGALLQGIVGLQQNATDQESAQLSSLAINCLRSLEVYGDVVWGARTLQGADTAASQWKYISIRRFVLFLESSLITGTQWVVFEPNAEPLWAAIRLTVVAFLQGLFLQGAFQGATPSQAYFVKCDADNNPPISTAQGVVNIQVGFAPLTPAEFVVIQIQQLAGCA